MSATDLPVIADPASERPSLRDCAGLHAALAEAVAGEVRVRSRSAGPSTRPTPASTRSCRSAWSCRGPRPTSWPRSGPAAASACP